MRGISTLPIVVVLMSGIVVGCSDVPAVTECGDRVAVALVTQTVREGADVVGSTDGARLGLDLADTLEVLEQAKAEAPAAVTAEIEVLVGVLSGLRDALEERAWDLEGASEDRAVQAALEAIEGDDVQIANVVVESYLTAQCGAATAEPEGETAATLPTPTGLVPAEDEPLTGAADNESDSLALGSIVALSFGLDLSTEQLQCLGSELVDVVDLSGEASSTAAYLRQFQPAFDACGIRFTVPVE